jgi:hypothetical protein
MACQSKRGFIRRSQVKKPQETRQASADLCGFLIFLVAATLSALWSCALKGSDHSLPPKTPALTPTSLLS